MADLPPPAHCVGCHNPVGSPHGDCGLMGSVLPEQARQLGGVLPLSVDGTRLELFLYRLLREGSPGQVERIAIQAEVPVETVSNPFLWRYALNIARRLTSSGGGDFAIVQMELTAPRDGLTLAQEASPFHDADLVVAVWPDGEFKVLSRRADNPVRVVQGGRGPLDPTVRPSHAVDRADHLLNEARSAIEGLLRVAGGTLSASDEETDIAAAKDWLAAYEAHA